MLLQIVAQCTCLWSFPLAAQISFRMLAGTQKAPEQCQVYEQKFLAEAPHTLWPNGGVWGGLPIEMAFAILRLTSILSNFRMRKGEEQSYPWKCSQFDMIIYFQG